MVLAGLVIFFHFCGSCKICRLLKSLLYLSSLYDWTFVKFAVLAIFVTVIFLHDMNLIYMIFTFAKLADFPAGVNISDQKTLPTTAKTFFLSVNGPNPLQRVHRPGAYGRSMHTLVPNDRFIDPGSMLSKSRFVTLNITSHLKSHNSPRCTHKSLR